MVRQPVEEECCAYKQEQYSVGEPAFAMYRSMQLRGVTLFDQMGKPTVISESRGGKKKNPPSNENEWHWTTSHVLCEMHQAEQIACNNYLC